MSATAQELESDIAQMEDRLANVKVVVEVEREAWRRSSSTGKRGTKWKGAAARSKEKDTASEISANIHTSDDIDGEITMMPVYWDSLELAQYLQSKQLTSYAEVIVNEQISGKLLLETPTNKLRKLFADVVRVASDPSWKAFQREYVKLQKHQRRLEKVVASGHSQPSSARSLDATSDQLASPSAVTSSASPALVFPLISPRPPVAAAANFSNQMQQNGVKPPTSSKPTFPLRKPASSNNIPMVTCWNCKTRFLRPYSKKTVRGGSTLSLNQPVSSSMRASLLARAYCSKACQQSIESSDIRISPSLSASVTVTFTSSNTPTDDKVKHRKPVRVATGLTSVPAPIESQPDPLACSESFTTSHLGGGNGSSGLPQKISNKHLRKSKTFVRRPSRPNESLNDPNSFDFLHVAAPKRKIAGHEAPQSQLGSREGNIPGAAAYASRGSPRTLEAVITATSLSMSSSVIPVNPYLPTAIPYSPVHSPNTKSMPPTVALSVSSCHGVPNQRKAYHQSKYKLDPNMYQAHEETFSSCFGAMPLNNRASEPVFDPGRGNLLRLQEFLTVRALHRLSLTSRAWYGLITTQSAFCDALWGIHVLRMWRPLEEDDTFLHDVGVLKKTERPRKMLQILTRQVARVTVENMKVLLSPESWQLATVMPSAEGLGVCSLHKVVARARDRGSREAGDSLLKAESRHQQPPAELFEQITAIYTRAGEIVAVCARQLIRPVDPMALLTDILQGIKSGELLRVHCRRLRLFSQTNRLPFDQWTLLSSCNRNVVEFFWCDSGSEVAVPPPQTLPVWHQKILMKLQHSLQQRLLGKDSIQPVIKLAHDQNAPANALLCLEKFLTCCHTHSVAANQRTAESNMG